MKKEGKLCEKTELRAIKYLNNIIESDHRRVKRRIRPMMGFKSFHTANRVIKGIEAMIMMIKNKLHFFARYLAPGHERTFQRVASEISDCSKDPFHLG